MAGKSVGRLEQRAEAIARRASEKPSVRYGSAAVRSRRKEPGEEGAGEQRRMRNVAASDAHHLVAERIACWPRIAICLPPAGQGHSTNEQAAHNEGVVAINRGINRRLQQQ